MMYHLIILSCHPLNVHCYDILGGGGVNDVLCFYKTTIQMSIKLYKSFRKKHIDE